MKNIELIVEIILIEKNIKKKDLIAQIGMSTNAWYAAMRSNSLKAQTLEKIARALEQPVDIFFDDDLVQFRLEEKQIPYAKLTIAKKGLSALSQAVEGLQNLIEEK